MTTVIICEKGSVARAIKDCLSEKMGLTFKYTRPANAKSDYSGAYVADDFVIIPCSGHLLTLKEPHEYDEKYSKWRVSDLPLCPPKFETRPSHDKEEQLALMGTYLKKADRIINAGDIELEGQLVVDELLWYFNVGQKVWRMQVNDNTVDGIWRAYNNMDDNANHVHKSYKAYYRQVTDWRFGMNLSRLFSVIYRDKVGGQKISVGRVQSSILTMVVERDLAHENHTPTFYYKVQADFSLAGVPCKGVDIVYDPNRHNLDEKKRMIDKDEAISIANKLVGSPATVTDVKRTAKKVLHPFPFNNSALLQHMAKVTKKVSMDDITNATQSLYEKKLITYPRTELHILPTTLFPAVPATLQALQSTGQFPQVAKADPTFQSRAWNDKEFEGQAHHGIIPLPTINAEIYNGLSEVEKQVFNAVSELYIVQFYPIGIDHATEITLTCKDETLIVRERVVNVIGWREALGSNQTDFSDNDMATGPATPSQFTTVQQGQTTLIDHAQEKQVQTTPPKRFTVPTLLTALSNISPYLKNPKYKEFFKQQEDYYASLGQVIGGIGTSATTMPIYTKLLESKYLEENPDTRQIKSTTTGRIICSLLDEWLKRPDVTAYWQTLQAHIETYEQAIEYSDRIIKETVIPTIAKHIQESGYDLEKDRLIGMASTDGDDTNVQNCPACGQRLWRRESKQKPNEFFWSCGGYKNNPPCHYSCPDKDGFPNFLPFHDKACSKCKGKLVQKTSFKDGKQNTYLQCVRCKSFG